MRGCKEGRGSRVGWLLDCVSIRDPCPLWTSGSMAALGALKCGIFLINPPLLPHLEWLSVTCWGLEKASPSMGKVSWALKDEEEMGSVMVGEGSSWRGRRRQGGAQIGCWRDRASGAGNRRDPSRPAAVGVGGVAQRGRDRRPGRQEIPCPVGKRPPRDNSRPLALQDPHSHPRQGHSRAGRSVQHFRHTPSGLLVFTRRVLSS